MFRRLTNTNLGERLAAALRDLALDPSDQAAVPAGRGVRRSLHASEDGFLSFVTCIVVLFFTVLLALVLNTGGAVKQKVDLQNAADASILTSTSVAARGMNAVTMTNHLIGELTAILVIHEALGGSTMDDLIEQGSDGKVSNISKQQNQLLDNGVEAVEMPYQKLDRLAVDQLIRDGKLSSGDSGGKHLAFASIFDSRLTLKYNMLLCLVGRAVAFIVQVIPVVGKAISIGLHITISFAVAKILQEVLLIDGIEQLAQLFSRVAKRRIVEKQILPFMENYGEVCKTQFPRIGAKVAEESAKRNGVTLFLFPQRLELAIEREPAPSGGGGDEPEAGPNRQRGVADFLSDISDASETINDFMNNPFFSAADAVGIRRPPPLTAIGEPPRNGYGYDGENNFSRKDLPRLSSSGWEEMKRSQWVRASYPYVRAWRKPIRSWFTGTLVIAQTSAYYSQWTNRYALAKPYWYRTGEYAGGGQRALSMFVMKGSPQSGKGREPWTTNDREAEVLFTQIAFVHRDAKTPVGAFLFGSGPKDGMVAYGQAIVYNANRQDPSADGKQLGRPYQPTIGWDTLNWSAPTNSARAYEFPNGDDAGLSMTPPGVPFVTFSKAPEHPQVKLNWQAKLTAVTRYGDARLTGAALMPAKMKRVLMKLPLSLGTFKTH
jgi:hypothetical protein